MGELGESFFLWREFVKLIRAECLSSIILSALNGNVNMPPHETGNIHVESEGVATSGGHFQMREGRDGVLPFFGHGVPQFRIEMR